MALIAALSKGLDISAWKELKNYESISPKISAEEAQKIYSVWRRFFAWSTKQIK